MTIQINIRWLLALVVVGAMVAVVPWALAGEFVWGVPKAPPAAAPAPAPAPVAMAPVPPAAPMDLPAVMPAMPPSAEPRRREAVLTMLQGTFNKTFAVDPFCKGKLVWTYEGESVSGTIELVSEAVGVTAELAIDSEVALSSSGVVFGVITAVRVNEFKVNPQMLAGLTEKLPFKVGPEIYPLIEPIVNELLVDMPFSYHCRVKGDRMMISQARIGPSGPMAKYAMVAAPQIAGLVQAPSLALEGTYTRTGDKPGMKPMPAPLPRAR